MPCIQIHLIRNVRSKSEIRLLADTIQQCSLDHFKAPPGDRYQIITQHDPDELIFEDTGLGLTRTDNLVFVQVFQQGRGAEEKQALYKAMAERLKEKCGLEGGDLVVSCVRNEREDWSFGMGRAQFLTGEL